jgi:hypothetical protein
LGIARLQLVDFALQSIKLGVDLSQPALNLADVERDQDKRYYSASSRHSPTIDRGEGAAQASQPTGGAWRWGQPFWWGGSSRFRGRGGYISRGWRCHIGLDASHQPVFGIGRQRRIWGGVSHLSYGQFNLV